MNVRATAVAPWSVSARVGAPVAMPMACDDLVFIAAGDQMTVPEFMEFLLTSPDDPWQQLRTHKQRLTSDMVERVASATSSLSPQMQEESH